MESGVVRALCRARSVPSATVRVISDAADEALPVDFNRLFDARFRIRYLRLAGELARSPRLLPALINFRKRVAVAAEELSKVLARGLNLPRQ
jgi:hypothetical protein